MQRFIFCIWFWLGLTMPGLASEATIKRGLFVVPGAFVAPEAYKPLVDQIVSRISGQVIVEYASFPGNFPLDALTFDQLKKFSLKIKEEGFKPDITVIAHSQGGLTLRSLPDHLYDKAVLMGSYVQADWLKSDDFPWNRPVLSISGTIDRLTPPARVAYDSYRFSLEKKFQAILLDGVNHSQFANGETRNIDVPSPRSTEEALSLIGTFIASFMDDHMNDVEQSPDYLFSKTLLNGYKKSFDRDGEICRSAQLRHLGLEKEVPPLQIKLTHYPKKRDYPKFILDKSSIQEIENQTEIGVIQFTESRLSPIDIAPIRSVVPEVIACKMRSDDSVSDALEQTFKGLSCAEENLHILQDAYALLPPRYQEHLKKRGIDLTGDLTEHSVKTTGETISGPGIRIQNTFRQRGEQWALGSFFEFKVRPESLEIETFSVKTPLGSQQNRFLGAYYCKVLPPSRAFQALSYLGAS